MMVVAVVKVQPPPGYPLTPDEDMTLNRGEIALFTNGGSITIDGVEVTQLG